MATWWGRGTSRREWNSCRWMVFSSSILLNLILCFRVINQHIVTKRKSKTTAPCCWNGCSNWNLLQKHTNIRCQMHSSKILVILKPQRPVPRVLVCSLPLSFACLTYCFISRKRKASSGQLLSLKVSPSKLVRCQHHTHHFAQRNSCDEETVKK